jgi:hypothetical protein
VFDRHHAATAMALVGGDQHLGTGILDPVGQRLGRKAGEHHRMHGAQAHAGQHDDHDFGNHRQVNGDHVTLLHAEAAEHIGQTAHLVRQLAPAHAARLVWMIALPEDGGQRRLGWQVTIDTVDRGVQRAVGKPADARFDRIKKGVLDLGKRLDPVELRGLLAPEALRFVQRAAVERRVGGFVDMGVRRETRRHRKEFSI